MASDTNSYYLQTLLKFCTSQQHLAKLRRGSDKEVEGEDEEMDLDELDKSISSLTQAIRCIQVLLLLLLLLFTIHMWCITFEILTT